MHFKANVKGDTSNQPLKHYMQVFAPIYSHRSILVKICDRRSISLLLHPAYYRQRSALLWGDAVGSHCTCVQYTQHKTLHI